MRGFRSVEAASFLSGEWCDLLGSSGAERKFGTGALLLTFNKEVVPGNCEGSDQRFDTPVVGVFSLPCHFGCGLRGITVTGESNCNRPFEENCSQTRSTSPF